jgi:hypothetical protein
VSREVHFTASIETVFIEEGFDPAWFVTLPPAAAAEIAAITLASGARRAFGAVKVEARIGGSEWNTQLNAGEDTWTLPIKKPVRLAEGLTVGAPLAVSLKVF